VGDVVAGSEPNERARPRAAGDLWMAADREWFERLYVAADNDQAVVPWDRGKPHWLLERWVRARGISGPGRRALVVGCGTGGGRSTWCWRA